MRIRHSTRDRWGTGLATQDVGQDWYQSAYAPIRLEESISDDTQALGPHTQAMPDPPAAACGWVLAGRYRVIDRIGIGGMAEVFRAHDELLSRDVAVKVFRTQPVTPDSATGAQRQQLELQALARLNHPNLITLFDGSITGTDGPAFLVMELINGPSLSARIATGPVPEPQAREVGIQISDALAYVHAEGMVHRDVKPANILLGSDRTAGDTTVRARLSDFGIVRLLGSERLTSVDFTLGTASYLAPEQARGLDVGPVADVYALGLVLIETLTGVRSFDGPPLEAVMARLARGPDIPGHLPPPWPTLLAAMTALDPDARPTAEQVARALRDGRLGAVPAPIPAAAAGAADASTVGLAALGGPAAALAPAVADPQPPTDEPPRRRRAAWLLVAAGVVAALALGAFLLIRPASHSDSPDGGPGTTRHPTPPPSSGATSGAVAPVDNSGEQSGSTATSTSATPHSSSAHSSSARSSAARSASSAPSSSSAAPSTSTASSTSSAPPSGVATSPGTSSSPATPGATSSSAQAGAGGR